MTLRRKLTLIVLLLVTILAGCRNGPEETLTVMAGSELEDLEPLFPDIERETGHHLRDELHRYARRR